MTQLAARASDTIKGDMSDRDRFLTAREAAELLRVNYRTVLREAEAGKIPGRKVGREWRFTEGALREWVGTREADQTG